jgi:hypothetical protein
LSIWEFHKSMSILTLVIGLILFFLSIIPKSMLATDHSRPVLEPYKLAGKRMIFSNWFYIRPGHFDWLDQEGKNVYASSESKIDEHSAQFLSFDSPFGIRLFVEPAKREIPIIYTDKPWDKWGIRLSTLILDNGKFRLWGSCHSDNISGRFCYFESTDGIHWEKPDLGLVEFADNSQNNLLNTNVGLSVFIDPTAPPRERYKTVWHSRISSQEFQKYSDFRPWSYMAIELDSPLVHVVKAAVSADGFQWTELEDPIAFEHGDTQNICYYDSLLEKYVLYIRNHMVGSRAEGHPYPREKFHQRIARRAIGRSESADFKQFPLSQVIVETDLDMHPSDQYYTNCRTHIPDAPDHHLMFPAIYNVTDDETRILLYSSYDGKNWHKVPGPPVLETQEFGKPDGGCVFAHPNLVERKNGDWILPYDGYNVPHKYPRGEYRFEPGMLVWPKGRLVGIEAPEVGEFATVAIIPPGRLLKINALTKRTGYIKVEIVNMRGKPIKEHTFEDAKPIVGNHYWTKVGWMNSGDLGSPAYQPIMLRFRMKMAKIYGLAFE